MRLLLLLFIAGCVAPSGYHKEDPCRSGDIYVCDEQECHCQSRASLQDNLGWNR